MQIGLTAMEVVGIGVGTYTLMMLTFFGSIIYPKL